MTTTLEARDAIVRRWFTNWTGTSETFLQNEKRRPTRGVAYAVLTVSHTTSEQETIGAAPGRRRLVVQSNRPVPTIAAPVRPSRQ